MLFYLNTFKRSGRTPGKCYCQIESLHKLNASDLKFSACHKTILSAENVSIVLSDVKLPKTFLPNIYSNLYNLPTFNDLFIACVNENSNENQRKNTALFDLTN